MDEQLASPKVRPFLRWAGSKRRLVPVLQAFWEPERHSRYVEPFMGSACLFFQLRPERAVLSDSNDQLVELFQVVRDRPAEVHERLSAIPRTQARYYKERAKDPGRMKPLNRAVRFLYLNRNCFNGLYRTNNSGRFNVPYAGPKRRVGGYPSAEELAIAAATLEVAQIEQGDFDSIVRKVVAPGDLVYLDPPYAVANRRVFKQYGPQIFGLDDLQRLKCLLDHIDEVGSDFVVSYADCPEAREAFQGWRIVETSTRRNISGFSKHRRIDSELIVTNQQVAGL